MKRRPTLLAVAGLAGALAVPTLAQDGPRGPRDEMFRMVEAYILSNIQEQLELTDEQFVALLPKFKELQQTRREYAQARMSALHRMRTELRSKQPDETALTELVAEMRVAQRDEAAALARGQEGVDAVLTTVQQARYRLLEHEVERRIRELAGRAGRGHEDRPGGRRD